MWLPILQSLKAHFEAQLALKDAETKIGSNEPVLKKRGIRIRRAGEPTPRNLNNLSPGNRNTSPNTVMVWIDCWEHNNNKDPEVAYQLLYDLEKKVDDALISWAQMQPGLNGAQCVVSLEATAADGDEYRPSVGSRKIVKISYRY